ncbi:MAG: GNAT family N-acetyltransferase [Terriglobales bacterium]
MRRTVIATTANEIAQLRAAWEDLPAPTIFQTFEWNHAAAQVFADREVPHVIYGESESGAALIPAAVAADRLTLLGESVADYRDVLAEGDAGVLETAWSKAASVGLKLSTGALRADSDGARWGGFALSPFYGAPLVSRENIDAEKFASEHNRLGRWQRRLEREGVEFRCHQGGNSALVRRIYEEKGNHAAEAGDSLFTDPQRVEFMVQACAALGSACEIFTFESAGTLVASLVTFREASVRRFYTIQFNQAWAKYSPGMVLIYRITYKSLSSGLDCDYMTGEQGYKMRFATSVVPMYWVEASPQVMGSLANRHAIAA